MKIIKTPDEWQAIRRQLPPEETLGFVPTMGNLHAGHRALIEVSQKANQHTIVSIFVNPTQFNNADDFAYYPRTLDQDCALLKDAGVQYCFVPDENGMYPDQYHYQVHEHQLSKMMEGQHRPGHFTGVLTVVLKLFNCIRPHRAYFGEKDYQQYLLIREMTKAFLMDLEIVACPIVREPSGLAYSSRNSRLSSEERLLADTFAHIFHQGTTCSEIRAKLEEKGIQVDYIQDEMARRFAAVTIGQIRLIDNIPLGAG